tara:strand:- start:12278 stop:14608 length:2331 start_codon:yes stop_codon:yes gene_type:complete
MAAEYGININVRTQTQQLKNLQLQLKAVDNLAKSIKTQQIAPELKGGSPELLRKFKDRIAQIRNEVIVANNAFVNNTKQINNNAGEIRGFSAALRDARANVKLFSGEYNVLTQGIQKADFTARFKELKEFSRIAANQAANLGGAIPMARGTTFEDLMEFRPTNTREAINDYISMLRGLEARLDRTSDRFRQVTRRIKEMETQLRQPIIADSNAYSRPAGPRQAMAGENFFNRAFGQNRQFQEGGLFFEPGGFASRRRNALSSGLIGGGFPLLFGQGVGASVGGGIGGIAGGFLGGGLGFGLSIVGTQLGKQVDVLLQATKKTGDALGDLTKDANVLVEALGNTNNVFGKRVKLLEQAEGKQAAFAEAVKQTTSLVGEKGVSALKLYGDETREIQTSLAQIFLQFQAGLARVNQFLGVTKALADLLPRDLVGELNQILDNPNAGNFDVIKGSRTGLTASELADTIRKIEDPKGFRELMFSQQNQGNLANFKADAKDLSDLGNQIINNTIAQEFFNKELQHQIELNEAVGYTARQELKVRKKINDEIKKREEIMGRSLAENEIEQITKLIEATEGLALGMRLVNDEIERLDIEMIKLNDTGHQIVELSKAIGSSFSESFKGVISGTMTVQEAFRNMFMRIADHFLDMAAQMMANSIRRGILGLFTNLFLPAPLGDVQGKFMPSNPQFRGAMAEGGPVKGGSSYLVGERGPEIFTPGVSGGITPNHALGGSTNVTVNVDAAGSNVEGDAGQAEQLGQAISQAIQAELIEQKRPGGLLYS